MAGVDRLPQHGRGDATRQSRRRKEKPGYREVEAVLKPDNEFHASLPIQIPTR